MSYSTLQQSRVLQQAHTCSHSRPNSHIYYFWNAYCTRTHLHKVNTIAFGFIQKVKMCGNYFWVASAIACTSIYLLWNLLLPCVPDMLRSGSPQYFSAGVFLQHCGKAFQLLTVWDGQLQLLQVRNIKSTLPPWSWGVICSIPATELNQNTWLIWGLIMSWWIQSPVSAEVGLQTVHPFEAHGLWWGPHRLLCQWTTAPKAPTPMAISHQALHQIKML